MKIANLQLTTEQILQRLANRIDELEELVKNLTERIESLEADRYAEETTRMERVERGYE